MLEKTISIAELKKLEKEGDEFDFPAEVMKIERFDELLTTLKTIADNEQERIRADIARNQTSLEILATLQNLIRKTGSQPKAQAPDLTPIRDVLLDIRGDRESRERGAYEFSINRDSRGFAQKIVASPVKQQTH